MLLFQATPIDPTIWASLPAWAYGIVGIMMAFAFGGGYKAIELWLKTKVELKKIEAQQEAKSFKALTTQIKELEEKVDKAREVEMALVAETAALKAEVKLLVERNAILYAFIQEHFDDVDTKIVKVAGNNDELKDK